MNRRDEVVSDPSERLYWVNNPVCLERREEAGRGSREEVPPLRLFAELTRKTGGAFARILGRGIGPC